LSRPEIMFGVDVDSAKARVYHAVPGSLITAPTKPEVQT
jgi:hypothetical protein